MSTRLAGVEIFSLRLTPGVRVFRHADWLLYAHPAGLVAVDLTQWPPPRHSRDDRSLRLVDHDPTTGRWLVLSYPAKHLPNEFVLEVRDGQPFPPGAPTGEALLRGKPLPYLKSVALFGDAVLAVPSNNPYGLATFETPQWITPGAHTSADGFEPEPPRRPRQHDWDRPARGLARLASGTRVVVWNGDGYELCAGRFERTFRLNARDSSADFTTAPWGDDGFFYLSNRALFRARRGGKPEAVPTPAENVMSVTAGPAGTVLMHHGRNDRAVALGVVRPDDGAQAGIKRVQLGIDLRALMDMPVYSAATGRVYMSGYGLVTVPGESLLAALRVPRARRR